LPIVISHSPANLIGQLASNAGQFATQQAMNQQALQAAAQQRSAQALDLQQARLDQQGQQFHDRLGQQVDLKQLGIQGQQDLEHQKNADRLEQLAQQYEAQGANQQTVAQLRAQAAAERQQVSIAAQSGWRQDANDTRRYGVDQNNATRTNIADQANNTRLYGIDENNQTRRDLARPAADNSQQAWNQQVRGHTAYLNNLQRQSQQIQHSIDADKFDLSGQRAGLQQKLGDLQTQMQEHQSALTNLFSSAPGTQLGGGLAPGLPPQMMQDPGAAPMPQPLDQQPAGIPSAIAAPADAAPFDQSMGYDSGANSMAAGSPPTADEVRAHVAALKLQGAPHGMIRQHLLSTFPDFFGGGGAAPQEQ
jgi:hypothetical protein